MKWFWILGTVLTLEAVGQQKKEAVTYTGRNGLKGEYFNGTNFNQKVLTRTDPQIYFNWRGRQPAPGVNVSQHSVRWTGKLLAPATGVYHFYAKVDDGVRIWVGGKKVIDAWDLNDSKDFSGSIIMKANQYYDLRVDYFNDPLEGEIQVYWQKPTDPKASAAPGYPAVTEVLPGKYLFESIRPVAPKVPPAKPVLAVKSKPVPARREPAIANGKEKTAASRPTPPPLSAPASASVTAAPPVAETFGKLESGKTLVLQNVFFEQSSYRLLQESYTELDKLVRSLKQYPDVHLQITGHTDNVGDPRLNLALSENRAKVVATYLTNAGIETDRITHKGYGSSRPLTGNQTETDRARNRRVEFTVK